MLRCDSSTIIKSKCPTVKSRLPSFRFASSIAFIIVGYVENTMRLSSGLSLLSSKLHSVKFGRRWLKLFFACVTSVLRSAKNKIFFTQLWRVSTSTIAMAVRVLPLPVAMTSNALRCFFSSASHTANTASF